MIDLDPSESEVNKEDEKIPKSTGVRQEFRKYAIVYSYVKYQSLFKKQSWISMFQNLSKQKKGFRSTYVLNFLTNIEEKDLQYRLQSKQYALIIKEIVEMFGLEVDQILSEENNQYQILAQQNSRMFKEFNRLNQFTEPLCIPQRLIGLDLFACLHEINYICQNSQPKINRMITSTLMSDITRIKQIRDVEVSLKSRWKENFYFLNRDMDNSSFGILSKILFLVHLKKKLSSLQFKDKTLQLNEKETTLFLVKLPQQQFTFRGSHRFKYKFCELATYNPTEKDISRKSHLIRNEITRKVQLILERSQFSNQSKELRALILQYKVTLKALSEWINNIERVTFPKPQQIFQTVEKCHWNLLKNDSFDVLTKNTRFDLKEALSSQNFIGESICKIALERFRQYASVLNIQNKLMKKIEKGASLYIKRFKYSYKEYYYIHHKDNSGSTYASLQKSLQGQSSEEHNNCEKHIQQRDDLPIQHFRKAYGEKEEDQVRQEKLGKQAKKRSKSKEIKKNSFYTTIILGFSEDNDQFAFKYNQEIQDKLYIQHLVNFLKTNNGQKYNVYLSEVDFEKISILESTLCKMVQQFKGKLHHFVKFEACPSKYFYHLLAHSYVDKCLCQTSFESQDQFSIIISSAVLRIIKLINYHVDTEVCPSKIKDNHNDHEEQSCGQADIELLFDQCKKKSEDQDKIQQKCLKFDPKKICFKISNILMKKMSLSTAQFKNISWQGERKYTRKGNSCQYFFKKQDQNNHPEHNEDQGIIVSGQDFHDLDEEIRYLQHRILTIYENNWPFLTDLQITNRTQNFVSFLKEVNCGIVEIKALFRNMTRNLIIYQAYFNELFRSTSEGNKDIEEKYWKYIHTLSSFYNKQLENMEKELPNMMQDIFTKILNDFRRFPITQKNIYAFNKNKPTKKIQTMLKVQYKEEDCPIAFTMLEQEKESQK